MPERDEAGLRHQVGAQRAGQEGLGRQRGVQGRSDLLISIIFSCKMTQIRIRILHRPVTWQKCELEEVPKEFNQGSTFHISLLCPCMKCTLIRSTSADLHALLRQRGGDPDDVLPRRGADQDAHEDRLHRQGSHGLPVHQRVSRTYYLEVDKCYQLWYHD